MTRKLAINGGEPIRSTPFPSWPVAEQRESEMLQKALKSGIWSGQGPIEREFTTRFAAFCGAEYALCVANGTVALEIALRALGIQPGDEVIVPALTWNATAWAVVQLGAVPVFADVSEIDWCLDPDSVSERITPSTRAIVPVHLYHQVADLDRLLDVARKASLFVLEDCAHVVGARWRQRGIGTIGHIGSFSFQQSKGLTSGEGGAIITNDRGLAQRVYALTDCGKAMLPGGRAGFGGNYRITEFQAAVLVAQLERLEPWLARKARNLEVLEERLLEVEGITPLPRKRLATRLGMYGLALRYNPGAFGGLPRTLLIQALRAEGIPIEIPYSVVYRSPYWTSGSTFVAWGRGAETRRMLGLGANCPVAERLAESEGLVLFHELFLGTETDMADIANAFKKIQLNVSELRFRALDQKARDKAKEFLKWIGKQP